MSTDYCIVALDTVDSTNDEARRRVAAGAGHGTVVWAHSQSAGRGRRGRRWESPRGNLYATLVVFPPGGKPLGQLSFVAALAVGDALADIVPLRYKWPNDLLVNRRKLGGILIETSQSAALVGVGINVAVAPTGTAFPATSLAAQDVDVGGAEELIGRVCEGFERWYGRWIDVGFAPLRDAWLMGCEGLGEEITVRLPTERISGRFVDLDGQGALLLHDANGAERRISAGDVFFGNA